MTLVPIRYRDIVRGADVRAYTDACAHDEEFQFYLLSLVGPDSAVRALSAAAATACELEVLTKPPLLLRQDYWEGYRIRSAKLPCGFLHQMVLARPFFEAERGVRLLYVGEEDPADLNFHALQEACAVPLLPEWKEWLYREMKGQGLLEELSGTVPVIRVRLNEEAISEMVSQGVKSHALAF